MSWPKKDNDKDKYEDIDYNSENWEPEFMTIFVTWQLRATLDSIRNSCDVYDENDNFHISVYWMSGSRPGEGGEHKMP